MMKVRHGRGKISAWRGKRGIWGVERGDSGELGARRKSCGVCAARKRARSARTEIDVAASEARGGIRRGERGGGARGEGARERRGSDVGGAIDAFDGGERKRVKKTRVGRTQNEE